MVRVIKCDLCGEINEMTHGAKLMPTYDTSHGDSIDICDDCLSKLGVIVKPFKVDEKLLTKRFVMRKLHVAICHALKEKINVF